MSCPCGLTQEKLDAHKWVDNDTGECIAPYKDVHGVKQKGCGELYTSHPAASQGDLMYSHSIHVLTVLTHFLFFFFVFHPHVSYVE